MQTQTQVPGQAPGPLQNENTHNSGMQGLWRQWQTESDNTNLRRDVADNINRLFKHRKQLGNPEWQQRLPDFVKRLEEALYNNAASKEEYEDYSTLEQRLKQVAKWMVHKPQQTTQVVSSSAAGNNMIPTPGTASNMIPTPGTTGSNMLSTSGNSGNMPPTPASTRNLMLPGVGGSLSSMIPMSGNGSSFMNPMPHGGGTMMLTPGTISNMIPTPGHASNNVFGIPGSNNMMPTSGTAGINSLVSQQAGGIRLSQNGHVSSSIGMTVGNQMIPTPGLTSSQAMNLSPALSAGLSEMGGVTAAQLQQFRGGLNDHFRGLNGLTSSVQHKSAPMGMVNGGISNELMLPNGQHLMNGSSGLHNASGYPNVSQFSNAQHQHQQRLTQQQQQQQQQQPPPLRMRDGYAMNAADLAGSASLFSAVSGHGLAGNNLGGVESMISPKMIPVQGFPPTQTNQLQQIQHTGFHQNVMPGVRAQQKPQPQPQQQQQQRQMQQLPRSQGIYESQQSSGLVSQRQSGQHEQAFQQSMSQHMQQSTPGFPHQHHQNMQHQRQQTGQNQQQQQGAQSERQHQATSQQQNAHLSKPASQHILIQQQQQRRWQVQHNQQLQQQQQRPPGQLPSQSPSQNQSQQQAKGIFLQQTEQTTAQGSLQQQQPPMQLSVQQQDQQLPQQQEEGVNGSALSPLVQNVAQLGSSMNGNLPGGHIGGGVDAQRQQQYFKQQRWLLFLRHASKCTAPEGQCQVTPHCNMARRLWTHIGSCRDRECTYSRCNASRTLLHHHQQCRDPRCPVCGPVRQQVMNQQRMQAQQQRGGASGTKVTQGCALANVSSPGGLSLPPPGGAMVMEDAEAQSPPAKRVKMESSKATPILHSPHTQHNTAVAPGKSEGSSVTCSKQQHTSPLPQQVVKSGTQTAVKVENAVNPSWSSQGTQQVKLNGPQKEQGPMKLEGGGPVKEEFQSAAIVRTGTDGGGPGVVTPPVKPEPANVGNSVLSSTVGTTSKSGKPKNLGTSLTELFTPQQIREHITGLRQWVGQSKAKAEKNQAMEHQMHEGACPLCAVEKLTFEPPPIYCTACGIRIKRNASYYTTGSGDTRHYFCVPCYNDVRTENVEMEGQTYPKSRLEKKRNDEETEEAWVQCDKCNLWQHQVCALFNGRRNEGDSEYVCPECCMLEMERGERKPLPPSAVLGALDLPKTLLSDHLEQRLASKLKQERLERAKAQGKNFNEVPGAETLVVRVISSVDKKLEVKQRFLELFSEEDYPTDYPYKSKVVLLFQKIEGVEVCLFGMYVQEFGAECSLPNQRRVYLSYLDSVKYFRPDVRTVRGEALRTFVYHEILIGYLDYCRKRGFSSCYIWACPPLKGEDYILYCHPEIQKTPKSDKLRDWYLTMLRKATADNIVVDVTNLYDFFFTSIGECKAKVTAARLPYFDGDYWPGAAEDMIMQLQQQEEDGRNNALKKGKTKKAASSKRASKAVAQAEMASNASKDTQLMHKLGESILPMKEDFIMVHMHHACSHCRLFIVTGCRWVCGQCKNFQLCDRCHDAEQMLDEKERHPISSKDPHPLQPVEVNDVPLQTKDKDEIMESEFFDTRQAFLSLCQGNHYQYDTLRRAKHSSMMMLYHLHNPTAPAFVVTCNMCSSDIEAGQGWRCEICVDFDLCNNCKALSNHQHKLTPLTERNAQNKEARQQRVLQLRKMLELLVHASQCGSATCQYPKCRSVKGLFRHGINCKIRASGGCGNCKRMWYLLQLHARSCKESGCRVPRCRDLNEHLRRLQQQAESRRRVAVMEMMRQRAAEAAGTNS
ncbi:hypothetical protein CY35_05G120700 [Sphagnum magellanicum]|nr:hypothetical protein CY35_05G120700 [Sphagnum magellanicum]KAH9563334.1 hypothetical protein CY35_05G120700 [Sphagnum magellanicum]